MTTTHDELQRDMGRVEASLEALEKIVQRGFDDVKGELRDLKREVESLKTAETERKGAWKVIAFVSSIVSAVVAFLMKVALH